MLTGADNTPFCMEDYFKIDVNYKKRMSRLSVIIDWFKFS